MLVMGSAVTATFINNRCLPHYQLRGPIEDVILLAVSV